MVRCMPVGLSVAGWGSGSDGLARRGRPAECGEDVLRTLGDGRRRLGMAAIMVGWPGTVCT
ncbi:hypothetical protein CcI156_19270 [Frankia sp. CcI156]|nr:hypothetical protein CcI156_19270 [Frankia sp. CcI156]